MKVSSVNSLYIDRLQLFQLGGLNYKLKRDRAFTLKKDELIIGFSIDLAAGGLGNPDVDNQSVPTVLAVGFLWR